MLHSPNDSSGEIVVLKDKHIIWEYLDTDGQIIRALLDGPLMAGQIYKLVATSQPVVSKKLARLQDEGLIVSRRDAHDRRIVWYELSEAFLAKLFGEQDGVSSGDPVSFVKK